MKSFARTIARKIKSRLPPIGVSTDYSPITAALNRETVIPLIDSWKSDLIPARQRELVDRQLAEYAKGTPNAVFDVLVEMLKVNIPNLNSCTLLEVGCSSGYYSEVLRLRQIEAKYLGCDYSEPFINLAREKHPQSSFRVEDATNLHYENDSFDIVVSGCCILHIDDYDAAIAEAARVSRKYVLFHRTPVLHLTGPSYFRKKAYGVDTFEIHFNEHQLIQRMRKHGLNLADVNSISTSWVPGLSDALAIKTYLLTK